MKTRFVKTSFENGKLAENTLRTTDYKTERGIYLGLADIADKTFGKGNWKAIPTQEGFAGYYAVEPKTGDTITADSR